MDIYEIRFRNFETLRSRFKKQRDFTDRLGKAPSLISQLATKHRDMGDELAREIEGILELPHGWFDVSHAEAETQELQLPPASLPPDVMTAIPIMDLLDELARRLVRSESDVRSEVSSLILKYVTSDSPANWRRPSNFCCPKIPRKDNFYR